MQLQRREVGGGQHGDHAGDGLRLRGVDALDAGVGVGGADEVAVQHVRQRQVVHVVAAALGEAHVLHALAAAAHAFQLRGPFGGRGSGHVVHSAASFIAPPLSLAAAYSIALTMFW